LLKGTSKRGGSSISCDPEREDVPCGEKQKKKKKISPYLVEVLLALWQLNTFAESAVSLVELHGLTPVVEGACDIDLICGMRPVWEAVFKKPRCQLTSYYLMRG
jgi:hypothetical protein